jgi:methionine-rich copper-binding protein CopC
MNHHGLSSLQNILKSLGVYPPTIICFGFVRSHIDIVTFRRRRVLAFAFVLLLSGFSIVPLFAHAKLVRSTPANKAVLKESPKIIELWFNELLEDEFNTIDIFKAGDATSKDRKNLAKNKPKVDAKDRTHLILPLDILPAGEYVAEYRVLSRDSHTAPGRISFSISPK